MNNESRKISGIIGATLLLIIFCLPSFSYAQPVNQPGVSQTSDTGITYECPPVDKNGVLVYGECDFNDLVEGTKKIVNFGTGFALMFSVVVIAWAGFNYMISGDNASKRSDANKMLLKVLYGIGYILAAWLIVTLILNGLGVVNSVPRILK